MSRCALNTPFGGLSSKFTTSNTSSRELDVFDLEASTKYANGYRDTSPIIVWLWKMLHSFGPEDVKRFLHFVTGSDRVPIKVGDNPAVIFCKVGFDGVAHADVVFPAILPHNCCSRVLVSSLSLYSTMAKTPTGYRQHSHASRGCYYRSTQARKSSENACSLRWKMAKDSASLSQAPGCCAALLFFLFF